ncbi:MAG: hypothetical protein QM677_01465 [Microbacterium sp.]
MRRAGTVLTERGRTLWEHLALVALGIGGPFAYAMASPIYSSADEAAHVDYALRVWGGSLPVFEDALQLQISVGATPPVQWTSQHPPLLYVLLAPVVGPLVGAGHPLLAGMAARGVVVLLSLGLVYAVRAAALALAPARKDSALAAAAVIALSLWFIRLGGSVYNDMLAALMVALCFAFAARLVRGSARRRDVLLFVAAASGCALSRLSAIPLALSFAVAVGVGAFLLAGRSRRLALAAAVGAPLLMVLTSGWFYLRNYVLTGTIAGGNTEWAIAELGRQRRPFWDVAFDAEFWSTMTGQFATPSIGSTAYLVCNLALMLAPAIAGLVLYLRSGDDAGAARGPRILLVVTFLAACGGVGVMQVLYTAGAGAANSRYFFVVIPLVAVFVATALVPQRGTAWLLLVWLVVRVPLVASELVVTLGREFTVPQAPISPVLAWCGYGILALGAAATAVLVAPERVRVRLPRARI